MADRNLQTQFPAYTWRPLRPADEAAIADLGALLSSTSGEGRIPEASFDHLVYGSTTYVPATGSLGAFNPDGQLVALGRVAAEERPDGRHFFLQVRIHPQIATPELDAALIGWLEERASALHAELGAEGPGVLRFDSFDSRPEAGQFFEQHGYSFHFGSDTLRRDLTRPIPEPQWAAAMELIPWQTGDSRPFQVYTAAFSERPGFSSWSEAEWVDFVTGEDTFRPDLSFLLLDGDAPAGYVACAVDTRESDQGSQSEGWILHLGVHPAHRRRRIGSNLLRTAMRLMAAEGLPYVLLEVNLNNPNAASLYGSEGFESLLQRLNYRKPLAI